MDNFQCRVCNNNLGNRSYIAQEMMFGLRERFTYFQCSECGLLQIAQIPLDMTIYYPKDTYYSYQSGKKSNSLKSRVSLLIRKRIMAYYIDKFNVLGFFSIQFTRFKKQFIWITQLKGLKYSSEILDVGCGSGLLLLDLKRLGFNKIMGIDPFIEKDISYPNGVQIFKKNIYDLHEQFDLIMLNHSFEHMDNPNGTFEQLYKLLKPDGQLLIRIPVIDSYSWRKYGVSWYQLDAPRHFFLHSVKSMSILSKNVGFDLSSIEYDSNETQISSSEKYLRNKSLYEHVFFEPRRLKKWRKYADWLNSVNDGDQACFVFNKNR